MRTTLLIVAVVAISSAVVAEESPTPLPREQSRDAQAETEDTASPTPRPSIKVLQDPYDLASFYRAGGSAPEGWAGLTQDPGYAIAGFYRSNARGLQHNRYGWSAFWTAGYGARRPAPLPAYRRTIGENGDLFLLVPFLAPVGPISGAFFGY